MANDTFDGIARKLLLRCPKIGPFIARDLVKTAFHDIVEKWQWSWLLKRTTLTVPNKYVNGAGTVTATYGLNTVTTSFAVPGDIIGQQFRVGVASPILTITTDTVVGGTTLTLSDTWTGQTSTNTGSFTIYQAYITMPSDFHAFYSVVDPTTYWPIQVNNVTLEMIDNRDPQRSVIGSPPRVLVPYDYYNGLPRYEFWPHQTTQAFYNMAYESRPTDPFDENATVPALLPSDVLLECALMYTSKWPGPNRNDPNPYYSGSTAEFHQNRYNERVAALIKQDVEHMQTAIWYEGDQGNNSRNMNASYMQAHDLTKW